MATQKTGVRDAWDDDDWVNPSKPEEPAPPTKLTKSQKRAQHQELQKQLWDSAPQEFRPQVRLLSRKPAPPATTAKRDIANGVEGLSVDDGDDSEEEARKKQVREMEERTRRAKVEREEKQRKYAEVRERIMGSSTPGQTGSRESSQGRGSRTPRGGGRGNGSRGSQPTSAAHSPTRAASNISGLFDPEDMGRRMPLSKPSTPNPDGPTRQPRAPPSGHDSRGGFGFVGRGGKAPY
ncbi:hypothetical protein B0A55_11235 [Friedmanniomyces simplex]|uniref:SUZ domain-containing protein n=1 Tax=Friedmanniomyces simplex TaxID=329884 RepID=A0A4U0WYN0_9PEZI|nr:hypothetical protein B0A55_11235 [Friedmanniomyces simplex]